MGWIYKYVKGSVSYFIPILFLFHQNSPLLLSSAKQYNRVCVSCRVYCLPQSGWLFAQHIYSEISAILQFRVNSLVDSSTKHCLFVCLWFVVECLSARSPTLLLIPVRSSSLAFNYPAPSTVSLARSNRCCKSRTLTVTIIYSLLKVITNI